jgi:hypothetical protein
VELFARLAPDLRLEADKVESRLRQELDLDVVADEERGVDLESDLAVDAFQNVPGRLVRRRSTPLTDDERQQTVVRWKRKKRFKTD